MGQLMETIQAVARGQEIMAKMQEEMNQRAHGATSIPNSNPSVVETHVLPHGNIPAHILMGAIDGVPPSVLNPLVIKVDDRQDAIFSPRVISMYDAFGPSARGGK